jgi:2-succinyl-5-enolpyruvyl-6-hydroxy-3-cyclohexene-1-carboxylate synthase
MVVLTADRPWDAYDCAAPQTIDQCKLYGHYVRHYAELGLPDEAAFSAVVRVAHQSVSRALGPDPGPVHINARFRKPLEPTPVDTLEPWRDEWTMKLNAIVTSAVDTPSPSSSIASQWAYRICYEPRGLICCGPSLGEPLSPSTVAALSDATGYPVVAEATSDLRFCPLQARGQTAPRVYCVDALFSSKWLAQMRPTVIIELGLPLVSTPYARFINESFAGERLVLSAHGYQDPSGSATMHWSTHVDRAIRMICDELRDAKDEQNRSLASTDRSWLRQCLAADARAQSSAERAIAERLDGPPELPLTEGLTASVVRHALVEDTTLVIANSAVLRDMDAHGFDGPTPIRVVHQRGASGIDGLISLAVGVRSARKTSPVVLYIGDIATWHDIGALQLAAKVDRSLVVVVVQNHGGRIFDRLPLSRSVDGTERDAYARFFVTDQEREFADICRGFSVAYERVESAQALSRALHSAQRTERLTVIEAVCLPGGAARAAATVAAGAAAIDSVLVSRP